jgi:DNA-binding FadR family transcriptional regulator
VRQGDAMRVTDWRTSGGLDVVTHVLFAAGGLDRNMLADLLEARRLMLTESARLAAEKRDPDQAGRLVQLAERFADAEGASAQAIDWEFFHELVETAGNVVLVLVMNSIRRIYFKRSELFESVVADGHELAPLYLRAARAVERGRPDAAGRAIRELTLLQERALMESLP